MATRNNNTTNNTHTGFTPPPPADLSNPNDAEVWLDLVTSALKGYCGAAWAKDKGPIQTVNSSIAARMSCEAADFAFAEFKKRRK